jgi:hypothetical protein
MSIGLTARTLANSGKTRPILIICVQIAIGARGYMFEVYRGALEDMHQSAQSSPGSVRDTFIVRVGILASSRKRGSHLDAADYDAKL